MKLKKVIKSLEEVPSEFRSLYKKIGDNFVFQKPELEEDDTDSVEDDDVETIDASDKDKKIKEMRANNIKLMKQLQEYKQKLDGIDFDLYNAGKNAVEHARTQEEKDLLAKGKYEEAMEKRLSSIREQHQKELKKFQDEAKKNSELASKHRKELSQTKIEAGIHRAAEKAKVRFAAGALPDVLSRASSSLDIDEDGSIVGFEGEGDARDYRQNPDGKKWGITDFFQELTETAPHLFEGAVGADIDGGPRRRSGGRTGVIEINPNDVRGFGNNIENIAKGKVEVRMSGS